MNNFLAVLGLVIFLAEVVARWWIRANPNPGRFGAPNSPRLQSNWRRPCHALLLVLGIALVVVDFGTHTFGTLSLSLPLFFGWWWTGKRHWNFPTWQRLQWRAAMAHRRFERISFRYVDQKLALPHALPAINALEAAAQYPRTDFDKGSFLWRALNVATRASEIEGAPSKWTEERNRLRLLLDESCSKLTPEQIAHLGSGIL